VARSIERRAPKPLEWVGSSKEDLTAFPSAVRKGLGFGLFLAQLGDKAPSAKPLKGFGGAGVVELLAAHDGNAYRAVYTVKFADAVFVLHAYQKKSKRGSKTPPADSRLIRQRLAAALQCYEERYKKEP
jgi:phage-related protein